MKEERERLVHEIDNLFSNNDNLQQDIKKLQKENEKLGRYKLAWKELYSEDEKPCGIEYMQDLEEKYNLLDEDFNIGSDKDE